jgi:hypothetical protein
MLFASRLLLRGRRLVAPLEAPPGPKQHAAARWTSASSASSSAAPPPPRGLDERALRAAVLKGDAEAGLCGAFLPASARESFFAMRAFNIELAGVRDAARGNAQAARVRLAFWRDFVES